MSDYKHRFQLEHFELVSKIRKLDNMLQQWSQGTLHFTPTTSRNILRAQLSAMLTYASILEERAVIEDVELLGEGFNEVLNKEEE